MQRIQDLEGVLIMDNRESPGLPISALRTFGLADRQARMHVELPVYTCSHCHAQVVMNPLRTRERHKCLKCNHVICDGCKARQVADGGACKPLNAFIEEQQEKADKANSGASLSPSIILSTRS